MRLVTGHRPDVRPSALWRTRIVLHADRDGSESRSRVDGSQQWSSAPGVDVTWHDLRYVVHARVTRRRERFQYGSCLMRDSSPVGADVVVRGSLVRNSRVCSSDAERRDERKDLGDEHCAKSAWKRRP
jgi:hypothetical protein